MTLPELIKALTMVAETAKNSEVEVDVICNEKSTSVRSVEFKPARVVISV